MTDLKNVVSIKSPFPTEINSNLFFSFDEFPNIDSSTSNQHIVFKSFCALTEYSCKENDYDGEKFVFVEYDDRKSIGTEKFNEKIKTSKTHGAYVNLINKQADIILVASHPSDEEIKLAVENGVKLELTPIAKDAFIFMKHSDNPIENLSLEQIKMIYSGKITKWSELGWDNGNDIKAYVRNPNSGSQETMKDLVMEGETLIETEDMIISTMKGLVYKLSSDPYGLGYSFFYYKNAMTQAPNTVFLSVDGVDPNANSIFSESYPLTTRVYLVMREEENPNESAVKLKDWLLSPSGQNVIKEVGYVPLFNMD
ncbi:MAG: hypothetical protein GF390_00025 [Candidatus Pacebacteria bacterium]|nr:hypothetical protein [Candidatus Paceibacterota bacterium]